MAITALRGLEILEALAGMEQPAKLRSIAQRINVSESQVFRVLQALEDDGYVDHLGRSGYRLASRSVALAAVIGPRPALLRAIFPVISRLATVAREAVVLHLRSGGSRVLILGVPAPSGPIMDPAAVLGERSPLISGASGRIILANLPSEELATIDLADVDLEMLGAIKERGYEMSFAENHPGINGVSGPLLATDERSGETEALGSISVVGPADRLTAAGLTKLVPPLLTACNDLAPKVASIMGPSMGKSTRALDL